MEKYEKLLNMIMDFNEFVRFAAVLNQQGEILWHSQQKELKNMVPLEDTKQTVKRAIDAWKENFQIKEYVGNGLYTIASYEKIKRITVPLDNGNILFLTMSNDPLKKSKTKSYGRLAQMGDILSIVDFIKSKN